jgi:DNA-binding transcriptional LysR family regulator
MPGVVLQAEAHGRDTLIRKLLDGSLDVSFMFEPPQMAELHAREIASVRLIMVSSRRDLSARDAVGAGYVTVDWGTSFAIAHARHFPDIPPARVRMGLGRMALSYLLANGGAAYLAEPMVEGHLAARRLYPVQDAPVIDRQISAVSTLSNDRSNLLEQALRLIPQRSGVPASGHATTA